MGEKQKKQAGIRFTESLMVATLTKVQYRNVQFKETYGELNCGLVKQGWFLSWHPHRSATSAAVTVHLVPLFEPADNLSPPPSPGREATEDKSHN